ncbi:hypothetical protein LTR28_003131, partial [Elasticomyces elasticus]
MKLPDTTSSVDSGHFFNRRRASSIPNDSFLGGWQKAIFSNLPSMPKNFTLPTSFPIGNLLSYGHSVKSDRSRSRKRSVGLFTPSSQRAGLDDGFDSPKDSNHSSLRPSFDETSHSRLPLHERRSSDGSTTPRLPGTNSLSKRPSQTPVERQPTLRRSASDGSLMTVRTLSHVSSLGDDSRFEHIQEQVNSRLKAIKDSWQDSNLRFSNLSLMSNLGFSGPRDDFAEAATRSETRGADLRSSSQRALAASGTVLAAPRTPMARSVPGPEAIRDGSVNGTNSVTKTAQTHPYFTKAVSELTGDVVVLGGYRGSILRSAEPPHRQLWVPIKVGLNLRKVDLEVGLDTEDEENMEERIIPGGMLTHIGPVDISRRLLKRLRASDNAHAGCLRVHNYGYDWRLDPSLLSKKLIEFLEKLPCNAPDTPAEQRGATIIAHSLGGLITRHAINQRPDLFSGVVYAGVPTTCVNILGPLRNGDDVLLSSRVLTAQVNFTIRTSFVLLPLDGRCFFNKKTKEEYPVDFFDVDTWIEHRLSPCVARPLPPYNLLSQRGNVGNIESMINTMASVLPSLNYG